jgi:hypothetical protein
MIMNRIKFFIIKVHNEYFAINGTQVIDVINGCNERIIEKLSAKKNAHFFYKTQPLKLLNSDRIFKSAENSGEVSNILVIKDNTKGSDVLYGLPINDVVGFEYFENKLLIAKSLVQGKEFCMYSFKHDEKLIHMLDLRKILDLKSGYQGSMPVMCGVKINLS